MQELEIPTGVPLVYKLGKDLKPIKAPGAVAPLSGVFLGDADEIAATRQAVADQTKAGKAEKFGAAAAPEGADSQEMAEVQFACIGSGCLMLSNDDMRGAFDLADADKNGTISPEELKKIVSVSTHAPSLH